MKQEINIKSYEKELKTLPTTVNITSPTEMVQATELLSRANKTLDELTDDKTAITKPINDSLKLIRAKYKPLETRLEALIQAIRTEMAKYQQAQLKAKHEAELAISKRIGEGKGKLKLETAVNKIANLPQTETKITTDNGAVSFRPVKKYEVMDIVMLANANHEAVVPNEAYIRKAMQAGIELAGVRYYEELTAINKR